MNARITRVLITLAVIVVPLSADLTGITTTPANLPAKPSEMTVGGGYLWILTEAGNLGKLAPGGAYVEFPLQFGNSQFGFTNASNFVYGFDGNVWVTGRNGHIERVTPSGAVTDFAAVPGILTQSNITNGADGALWFFDVPQFGSTSDNNSKLGRIDIYGQVTTYGLGLGTDFLGGLVTGGDGNLWFVDTAKNEVAKFSISTKSVAGTYTMPSKQNGGGQMILGLDGNLWFTHGTSVDRVKPDGTITEFNVPSGGQPSDISVAGDGNIWFTEYSAGKLGQLVVSSITSGGSATINESGAILPNGETLLLLPPGFATASGKTALDTKPCPLITFISKKTPPTAGVFVSTTVPQSTCADLATTLHYNNNIPFGSEEEVSVSNGGPDTANDVKVVVSLWAVNATSFITSVAQSPGDVQVTISGDFAILTKNSLAPGEFLRATVFFNAVNNPQHSPYVDEHAYGAVAVASSSTADPNPSNNVAAEGETILGGKRVPLQPDLSVIVTNTVQRGH